MKHLHKSIFSLAMASLLCLASCSQEDMLKGSTDTVKGHPVQLTLTVNRGEAHTRTALSENDKNGGLISKWVMNDDKKDKLFVFNSEGVKVGELEIKELIEPSVGVFSGTIEAGYGSDDYNIWYYNPDNSKIAVGKSSRNLPNLLVDLSEQSFSSVEDLSAMEVLYKSIKLNVKEETAVVEESTTMEAKLAMARFSLAGIENASGTLRVFDEDFADSRAIYKKCGFGLAPKFDGFRSNFANDPSMEVTVTDGQDVYLAFYPGSYRLGFEFTAAETNKKYKFAFNNPTTLEAGKYYCAFDKAGDLGEDDPGTIGGIPVNFEPAAQDYTINFATPDGDVFKTEEATGVSPCVITIDDYDNDAVNGLDIPEGAELKGWADINNPSTIIPTFTFTDEIKEVTLVPVYEYTWTITWKSEMMGQVVDTKVVKSYSTSLTTQITNPTTDKIEWGVTLTTTEKEGRFNGWWYNGNNISGATSLDLTTDDMNPVIWAKFNYWYIIYHYPATEGNAQTLNPDHILIDTQNNLTYKDSERRWLKWVEPLDYTAGHNHFESAKDSQPYYEEGMVFDHWEEIDAWTNPYEFTGKVPNSIVSGKDGVYWAYPEGENIVHLKAVFKAAPKTVATPGYSQGKFN